jgi:hypothetical protein
MKRIHILILAAIKAIIINLPQLYAQSIQRADLISRLKAEQALSDSIAAMDSTSQCVEFRSELLKALLPDIRVFVCNNLLILNREGIRANLGEPEWSGNGKGKYYRSPKVAEFLKSRNIELKTPEDAIQITKLTEALIDARHYIWMLCTNTKGFTVFDDKFLKWFFSGTDNWKYDAQLYGTGWTVTKTYVGPPAQIMMPPTYYIEIDANHKFLDIKQLDMWKDVPDSNDVSIDSFYVSYDTISGIVKLRGILLKRYSKEKLRDFPIAIGIENISGKKYSYNLIDSTRTDHNGLFCVSSKIQNAKHLVFRCGVGQYVSYGKLDDIISALREKRVAPNQVLKPTE